jgi:Fe-S-cluster containining protein
VATGFKYLSFRCTGCGNCCKEPLLPLTDQDLRRIARRTGHAPCEVVRWIDRQGIDMDDEPEAFVMLRQGRRVMTLKHERGRCVYLGADDRCTIYATRPLGCRVFPFDPTFGKRDGQLRRLTLIQATDCRYELDGHNDPSELRELHERYESETAAYHAKVADWNRAQRARRRAGKAARTAAEFLAHLGLGERALRLSAQSPG